MFDNSRLFRYNADYTLTINLLIMNACKARVTEVFRHPDGSLVLYFKYEDTRLDSGGALVTADDADSKNFSQLKTGDIIVACPYDRHAIVGVHILPWWKRIWNILFNDFIV